MNYANDFSERTCTFVCTQYLPGLPITEATGSKILVC